MAANGSDNRLRLNPELVVSKWNAQDKYLVENAATGALFAIAENEYRVLSMFDGSRSLADICEMLRKQTLPVDEGVLRAFVLEASAQEILVTPGEITAAGSTTFAYAKKLIHAFQSRFPYIRALLRVSFQLEGSFRVFRIFSVNLTDSWIERTVQRLVSRPGLAKALMLAIIGYLAIGILVLGYRWNIVIENLVLPTMNPLLFVVSFLNISLLMGAFHEMGHFIIYKYYGGKENEIGFGLLFSIVPMFYVNLNSSYLFERRMQRILTFTGGPLVDVMAFATGVVALGFVQDPMVLMAASVLGIAVMVRILLNVNPFLPGTDPYFILTELLRTYNLWRKSIERVKKIFRVRGTRATDNLGYGYVLFGTFGILSIGLQWCIAIVFFYMPMVFLLLQMFSIEVF